jgi:hypothetical protein
MDGESPLTAQGCAASGAARTRAWPGTRWRRSRKQARHLRGSFWGSLPHGTARPRRLADSVQSAKRGPRSGRPTQGTSDNALGGIGPVPSGCVPNAASTVLRVLPVGRATACASRLVDAAFGTQRGSWGTVRQAPVFFLKERALPQGRGSPVRYVRRRRRRTPSSSPLHSKNKP